MNTETLFGLFAENFIKVATEQDEVQYKHILSLLNEAKPKTETPEQLKALEDFEGTLQRIYAKGGTITQDQVGWPNDGKLYEWEIKLPRYTGE